MIYSLNFLYLILFFFYLLVKQLFSSLSKHELNLTGNSVQERINQHFENWKNQDSKNAQCIDTPRNSLGKRKGEMNSDIEFHFIKKSILISFL